LNPPPPFRDSTGTPNLKSWKIAVMTTKDTIEFRIALDALACLLFFSLWILFGSHSSSIERLIDHFTIPWLYGFLENFNKSRFLFRVDVMYFSLKYTESTHSFCRPKKTKMKTKNKHVFQLKYTFRKVTPYSLQNYCRTIANATQTSKSIWFFRDVLALFIF